MQSIIEDAAKHAQQHTGDILFRAIVEQGCTMCLYPSNCELFHDRLELYTELRLQMHRIERRINQRPDGMSRLHLRHYASYDDEYYHLATKCDSLKHVLKTLWPCSSCMSRFNPTRHVVHGASTLPRKDRFLL